MKEDRGEVWIEGDGALPEGLGFLDAAERGEGAAEVEESAGRVRGGFEGEQVEFGGALAEAVLMIEGGEGGAEFGAEGGGFGGGGEGEGAIEGGLGEGGFGIGSVEQAELEPGGGGAGVMVHSVLPGALGGGGVTGKSEGVGEALPGVEDGGIELKGGIESAGGVAVALEALEGDGEVVPVVEGVGDGLREGGAVAGGVVVLRLGEGGLGEDGEGGNRRGLEFDEARGVEAGEVPIGGGGSSGGGVDEEFDAMGGTIEEAGVDGEGGGELRLHLEGGGLAAGGGDVVGFEAKALCEGGGSFGGALEVEEADAEDEPALGQVRAEDGGALEAFGGGRVLGEAGLAEAEVEGGAGVGGDGFREEGVILRGEGGVTGFEGDLGGEEEGVGVGLGEGGGEDFAGAGGFAAEPEAHGGDDGGVGGGAAGKAGLIGLDGEEGVDEVVVEEPEPVLKLVVHGN